MQRMVFRVIKFPTCWRTVPASYGWEWTTDYIYSRMGSFRRLPEPNNRPLGMVVALTEDIDGNIWAECASKPRKLVRIRDFRVQEEFPESEASPWT